MTGDAAPLRLLAIVPFLNEAAVLPRFLASVAAQRRRPDLLVLVDDGSTDGSGAIAADFAARHGFAVALHRPPRPARRDRLATADELRAFQWALERVDAPWDVLAKFDGDLELTPETIDELLRRLAADPGLGIAGTFLSEVDAAGTRTRLRIRPEHVHGATKLYRRACWAQIAPLPTIMGWDTLDEVAARMRGWRTQSFALPGGDPLHLRPRGTHDGVTRGFRRYGAGAYALGDHPLHVVLYALRHAVSGPGAGAAAHYLAGWTGAGLRRHPRAPADVRAHIRADELRRIRERLWRIAGRSRSPSTRP